MLVSAKYINIVALASLMIGAEAYSMQMNAAKSTTSSIQPSRRTFFSQAASLTTATAFLSSFSTTVDPQPASAIGPIKIDLLSPTYSAAPCPPSRPIPGEKAMKGMKGLCVTVQAELKNATPKDLKDVGVYGFVTDAITGDSVLANNPDLSTDAGQFGMVTAIKTTDKNVEFEFVAAVPMEKDVSKFENGIGELDFSSLRVINFPGGQQFGEISPCEMNEFGAECEEWEAENGPYEKKEFMVKSNPRTKGR